LIPILVMFCFFCFGCVAGGTRIKGFPPPEVNLRVGH
jgi:hypothetical protein